MNQSCFICNAGGSISLRYATYLFKQSPTLSSGKSLPQAISDIVEKPVKQENIHTSIICKRCHKAVTEYDSLQIRLKSIKSDLIKQFKESLSKHDLNYDTYNVATASEEKKVEKKPLVLPASKLQPLPPDFVIRSGKWGWKMNVSKSGDTSTSTSATTAISSSSKLNLKVTVGSSVLTQSVNTSTIAKQKIIKIPSTIDPKLMSRPKVKEENNGDRKYIIEIPKSDLVSTSSSTNRPIPSISTNSLLSLNIKSLSRDSVSSSALTKVENDDVLKQDPLDLNNDEQSMEIDEECSLAVITPNEDKSSEDKQYMDVSVVSTLDANDYVLGKLLRADDTDEHTIVMDGEDGSIIRVVSGQKFLYGDSEISLVMPEDDMDNNDNDNGNDNDNDNDNGDSQDSNEESQIELQVSGDEETANAIIAAAQEKGGAFIKVESGEMYRVKSVKSKTEVEENTANANNTALQIVVQKDGLFRCLLCEKNENREEIHTASDAEVMMQHLRTVHSARVYICKECGLVMRRRVEYAAHLEQHAQGKSITSDKGKMHECNICHKKYGSRTLLVEHLNIHSGARPYQCEVCHKRFASKYTHQAHVKTHQERPRPFKCNQCGKSFFTLQNLNQHEKTHSGVKDFICNVCGKAFGTQHNLEVHGVVHSGSKPFVCGVCGKAFARRAEVRDHMRIHTGERPFECDICGARFTQRSNLHSHRRATHLDDKRYPCTRCHKRFKRRRLLDYHIKASHTGERPLKCEICQATFVYPEHFKKHARIHSGEKPYTCEVCGKSFNSRDNRNTHRFVHSDRKPYECVVCGAGYMRKQLLYHHMNTSGHLAESIVVNQPRVSRMENSSSSQSTVIDSNGKFNVDTIYETAEELELDNKSAGKAITLMQDGEETTLLTLHNIEGQLKGDGTLLETISTEQMTDEQGESLRLVQVELPDGFSLVAID